MKRVHYTDAYLLNPQHPVTVNLIGGGGTGSQVLTCLARLDATLRALGHPGLYVTLYDPDIVEESNIGRQLFSYSDLNMNKAVCLVSKVNCFFGNSWIGKPVRFHEKDILQQNLANIIITCTDTIDSRIHIGGLLKNAYISNYRDYNTPLYWMDFGNSQTSGQVIIGTVSDIKQPESKIYKTVSSMKVITEYTEYSSLNPDDSGPSCSLAEALEKQDLFINSTLAQFGCHILWMMFRHAMIEYQGLFMNLRTLKVNPISV